MPRLVNHLCSKTLVAAEALAAHRLVIQSSTDGQCEYPAAANDTQLLGITSHAAASGENVDVVMFGMAILTVDGNSAAIAAGDWIGAHGAIGEGQKAAALSDGATYYECIGKALEASTADGDEIAVLISPSVFQAA